MNPMAEDFMKLGPSEDSAKQSRELGIKFTSKMRLLFGKMTVQCSGMAL